MSASSDITYLESPTKEPVGRIVWHESVRTGQINGATGEDVLGATRDYLRRDAERLDGLAEYESERGQYEAANAARARASRLRGAAGFVDSAILSLRGGSPAAQPEPEPEPEPEEPTGESEFATPTA